MLPNSLKSRSGSAALQHTKPNQTRQMAWASMLGDMHTGPELANQTMKIIDLNGIMHNTSEASGVNEAIKYRNTFVLFIVCHTLFASQWTDQK